MKCEIEPTQSATPAEARKMDPETVPARRPAYRTVRGDHSWEVFVDLPGVKREAVDLQLEDGVLKLEARRELPAADGRKELHREIPSLRYALRLEIGSQFDPSGVTAKAENGVLRIVLPVAEAAKPLAIAVE